MNDTASILGGAALLLGAAAFAIRAIAQAKQGTTDTTETDLLIRQTAEQVADAVGKLRDVMDAVKTTRADVRHDVRNELVPVVERLEEVRKDLLVLTQRRR